MRIPFSLLSFIVIASVSGAGCGATAASGGGSSTATDTGQTQNDAVEGADAVAGEDAAAPVPTGLPAADGKPDIKFRPNPNGFPFQNYGEDKSITNMTAADVRRLFGDAACAIVGADGACTLTPPGEQWVAQANKAMDGGHCEGFAALALLFYQNKLNVADFGAATTYALQLPGNEKLQRQIATWFMTQATEPARNATIRGKTPAEVVQLLSTAFATGTDSYTLGIYKPEFKEGHAITPYAIVDKGGGQFEISVYDNNFPGEERAVKVDTTANTWSYTAAADPTQQASLYQGDATTKTLDASPTAPRLVKQVCPFCGDVTPPTGGATVASVKGAAVKYRTISLSAGKADLLIATPDGKRLGFAAGKLVNEIADADAIPIKSSEPWLVQPDPSYRVPLGVTHTVTIDGTALTAAEAADVVAVMPGYSLGVLGISLDPGQKDTLTFSADSSEITYKTVSNESPTLELGVTLDGADWRFVIVAANEQGGQEVKLHIDLAAGTLRVSIAGGAPSSSFAIEIYRIDDKGDQVFTHQGKSVAAADAVVIAYGKWSGNGSPMALGLDAGGDGSVDSSEDAADSQ